MIYRDMRGDIPKLLEIYLTLGPMKKSEKGVIHTLLIV